MLFQDRNLTIWFLQIPSWDNALINVVPHTLLALTGVEILCVCLWVGRLSPNTLATYYILFMQTMWINKLKLSSWVCYLTNCIVFLQIGRARHCTLISTHLPTSEILCTLVITTVLSSTSIIPFNPQPLTYTKGNIENWWALIPKYPVPYTMH